MFRLVRRLVTVVVIVAVLYVGVTGVQVVVASRRDERPRSDAIVVMGAAQYNGRPSPVLEARLRHALELYREDVAPTIVVTGGKGRPGDTFSEARAGARWLAQNGVPADDILWEPAGHSSWESLSSTARFLKRRDKTDVVLVSDPFHSARVAAIAEELGLAASVSPTRTSPISGSRELNHMARETLAMAAGRVIGFRQLFGADSVVGRLRSGSG